MKLAAQRFALTRWLCRTLATRRQIRFRTKFLFGLLIFLISFSVKSLHAVDLEPVMHTAEQPGAGMSREFDSRANSIVAGNGILLPDNQDPSDTTLLAQAPGYSIFLSAIYAVNGRSYFTVQLVQNAINSVSPVLLFLIAGNLISWRVGVVSGLLAAISHHLSYYSNLVLSDSLCALPVLISVYCVIKARLRRQRSLWLYAIAGVMIGLSAWIRPNTMLLGVFFGVILLVNYGWRRTVVLNAVALAVISFLTIAPITVRNYIVYREFVPIRIGIGIILWEGLGDVSGGRFGALSDEEVIRQEAALYDDARYGEAWASPDGIKRDRDRVRRSLKIIAEHPVWYVGTMFGRMAGMLKDTADAPLVFRSSDTKLRDALSASRSENQTTPKLNKQNRENVETVDRSALAIGKSISWVRPFARALQRVTKETGLLFIVIGLAILLIGSPCRALLILVVPLYYFFFQSFMHTEFRYTLAMRYFLFVFAAVSWTLLLSVIGSGLRLGLTRIGRLRQAHNVSLE